LFIQNYKPELWPAGVPNGSTRGVNFSDCDYGPAKQFILKNKDDSNIQRFYELSFAKRPKFELYDLEKDPEQLTNLAYKDGYEQLRQQLKEQLNEYLLNSADPRLKDKECDFKTFKYYGRKRNFDK
ncbi:MAG: DUF4976 domain-containing protein, partial [Lentisphaeraceae bacterium]|nr:DUF4976 domain-containing protein [Lentisphaeraceae bacterium]